MTTPGLISIVGMGRSGSTILEAQLASQYGGVAVGELVGVWGAANRRDAICSCGYGVSKCCFWQRVRAVYPGLTDIETTKFVRHVNASIMPVRRYSRWRRIIKYPELAQDRNADFAAYREEVASLYAAVYAATNDLALNVVIDSSKHPVFYSLARASEAFQSFRRVDVIRLVRDPRAVAYSLARPREDWGVGGNLSVQNTYSMWKAIPYWLAMNSASDIAVQSSASQLRYEDLVDAPQLDLMRSFGYQKTATNIGEAHQLVGNPARHRRDLMFHTDHRWLSSPAWGSTIATCLIFPWLRRYGYSLRRAKLH